MDPVIATSPMEIGLAGNVARFLPSQAGDRPLAIDYFASRHAGLTVGDITVAFADAPLEPRLDRPERWLAFLESHPRSR